MNIKKYRNHSTRCSGPPYMWILHYDTGYVDNFGRGEFGGIGIGYNFLRLYVFHFLPCYPDDALEIRIQSGSEKVANTNTGITKGRKSKYNQGSRVVATK